MLYTWHNLISYVWANHCILPLPIYEKMNKFHYNDYRANFPLKNEQVFIEKVASIVRK